MTSAGLSKVSSEHAKICPKHGQISLNIVQSFTPRIHSERHEGCAAVAGGRVAGEVQRLALKGEAHVDQPVVDGFVSDRGPTKSPHTHGQGRVPTHSWPHHTRSGPGHATDRRMDHNDHAATQQSVRETQGQGLDMQRWMDHKNHAPHSNRRGWTGHSNGVEEAMVRSLTGRWRRPGPGAGTPRGRGGCGPRKALPLQQRYALQVSETESAAKRETTASSHSWYRCRGSCARNGGCQQREEMELGCLAQTGGRTLGPARRSSALWSCRAGRAGACGTAARAHHLWTPRRQSRCTRRARRRKCRALPCVPNTRS